MVLTLCAPCLFGLEAPLSDELRRLDFQNIRAETGRVFFESDGAGIARTNLWLRTAERVLILAGRFHAASFTELFDGVRGLPWENYLEASSEFPVKGSCMDSKLHSVPDCQSIIKKAIVERMKEHCRVAWFKEDGARSRIQFQLHKDETSIYIDTSGDSLHKRGYRKNANIAPIRETLAAGIVLLSRYRRREVLCDPMCGSGTFAVEAALYAQNRAPGLLRRFDAERWTLCPKAVWDNAREQAKSAVSGERPVIFACDSDPTSVELTRENAEKAGVGEFVQVRRADITRDALPAETGFVVTNPPYGERMLDVQAARKLYAALGKACGSGHRVFVISPDTEFERYFGRTADKKRKLYNGMIRCDLYMYQK